MMVLKVMLKMMTTPLSEIKCSSGPLYPTVKAPKKRSVMLIQAPSCPIASQKFIHDKGIATEEAPLHSLMHAFFRSDGAFQCHFRTFSFLLSEIPT